MTNRRQKLGQWGETLAASYLSELGYTILAKNARTPYGELDLVATPPDAEGSDIIVFFEVKTRSTPSFGLPEQAVTLRKQEHLQNAALHFLQSHPEMVENWRFDVVSIQKEGHSDPVIIIFENAFGGDT
jgi:putative endonuclease